MRKFIATCCILVLVLAAGCKSHKSVTSSASDTYSEQRAGQTDARLADSLGVNLGLSLDMEALDITLTADSVVTPEGTYYNPSVTISAAKPSAKASASAEATRQASVQRADSVGVVATHDESAAEDSGRTVITEPPDNRLWLLAVVIATVAALVVAWLWWRRRRKAENN